MIKNLSIAIILLYASSAYSQVMSLRDLLESTQLEQPDFNKALLKKGFVNMNVANENDSSFAAYSCTKLIYRKHKTPDNFTRLLDKHETADEYFIRYQTTSAEEYYSLISQMKQLGFYCNEEADSSIMPSLLYQLHNVTVVAGCEQKDNSNYFCLNFTKKSFPKRKFIYYANDLMPFSSHEFLSFYFGPGSVKKDLLLLPHDKTIPCTVLFPNTPAQAIFTWHDEINLRSIENLLLGSKHLLASNLPAEDASLAGKPNR